MCTVRSPFSVKQRLNSSFHKVFLSLNLLSQQQVNRQSSWALKTVANFYKLRFTNRAGIREKRAVQLNRLGEIIISGKKQFEAAIRVIGGRNANHDTKL